MITESKEKELISTENLQEKLKILLNQYSRENISNTPDFILAEYMMDCLKSFEYAVMRRDNWYNVVL
jgi:hypothetical protein